MYTAVETFAYGVKKHHTGIYPNVSITNQRNVYTQFVQQNVTFTHFSCWFPRSVFAYFSRWFYVPVASTRVFTLAAGGLVRWLTFCLPCLLAASCQVQVLSEK